MPEPKRLTNADLWRLLPLISTSVWSGLNPCIVNERSASIPSATVCRGKLTDGETCWSISPTSEVPVFSRSAAVNTSTGTRSEEHTSELQSRFDLVCRLLLEKKQ